MQEPNLNRMWQTFIKIGLPNKITFKTVFDMIRSQIYPMISDLRKKNIINWYCFLIHDRESGVPTTPDDKNAYFHIRVSLEKGVDPKDFQELLPSHCVMTQQPKLKNVDHITIDRKGRKFDTSLLKNERIEEVWRILGKQSEWLINVLNSFKEDIEIPINHIGIFLHYYSNMTCLAVR